MFRGWISREQHNLISKQNLWSETTDPYARSCMNDVNSLAPVKAVWRPASPGGQVASCRSIDVLVQQGPRPSPQKPSRYEYHEVLHVETRQEGESHDCSQNGLDWQSWYAAKCLVHICLFLLRMIRLSISSMQRDGSPSATLDTCVHIVSWQDRTLTLYLVQAIP